jgi:hypothetical protein
MTFSEVLQDAEKHLFTQVPTVSQDESIDTIFAIEAKKFKNEIFTSGPVGELEVTGKLNFFFKEHSVQISNFLRLVGSPALRQIAIDGRELQFIKVEDADFIAEVARTYEQGSAPSAEKTQRAFEIIVSFYQFEPYEAIDKAYYKAFEIDKCRKVIQYLSDNYGF